MFNKREMLGIPQPESESPRPKHDLLSEKEDRLLGQDSAESKREKAIEEGLELVKKLRSTMSLHDVMPVAHELEQLFLKQLEALHREE